MKFGHLIALLTLLFAGGVLVPRAVFDVPQRELTAQAGGVATKGPLADVVKKADDLEKFLAELERRLNALPTVPPPPPPISGIELSPAPIDGVMYKSFGAVPLLEGRDKTFLVKNASGRSLTFAEFLVKDAEDAPFEKFTSSFGSLSFKGGAYPGVGGTCGAVILSECTVVLTLSPKLPDAVERNGRYSYWKALKIAVSDGAVRGESNVLLTGGSAVMSPSGDFSVTFNGESPAVFPGERADFFVRVSFSKDGAERAVPFANLSATGFEPPFFLAADECGKTTRKESCTLRFSFRPTSPGTFRQSLTVSVDTWPAERREAALEIVGAALSQSELNAKNNLLVVYNESWTESVAAKDYYLSRRPEFSDANVLGISFPVSPKCGGLRCLAEVLEFVPYTDIQTRVIAPIVMWLRNNPDKNVQYIVLMRGLPSRPTDATRREAGGRSVQAAIRAAVTTELSKEVFVTSLDTGSIEATRRYIDKLKSVYANMPNKSSLISARGTAKAGTTYYFSDSYIGVPPNPFKIVAQDFESALKAANPSADIVTKENTLPVLSFASNVSGFFIHGIYGYNNNGKYAVDGTIRFTGNSGWYLIETGESYNGQWVGGTDTEPNENVQGNFIKWFSSNAFGGTNYSNTPAAATTHVVEPGFRGANPLLYICWDSGKPFAYCAWKGDWNIGALQAVGDPWVTR